MKKIRLELAYYIPGVRLITFTIAKSNSYDEIDAVFQELKKANAPAAIWELTGGSWDIQDHTKEYAKTVTASTKYT